jgi:cytidylate kinase
LSSADASTGIIVALDGPAGAGKSTVAKLVAAKAGLSLVDTGAIYRTLALVALRGGHNVDDGAGLGVLAGTLPDRLRFVVESGDNRVILDGDDVSAEIRTPQVSTAASSVARHPEVRSALLGLQRALGRKGKGSVLEGRDIGTVVFPDADVKAFVTAAPEERAKRRLAELAAKGDPADYATVLADIIARDKQDAERPVAPLKPATDAVIVDTTGKSLEQVTDEILALITLSAARRQCAWTVRA